ncbi:unnamed protein product [Ectocarpus sp. CCAP 1310/34]|nr:unnamed protein product [Ectocarpus sp. CCAP 1310/34]
MEGRASGSAGAAAAGLSNTVVPVTAWQIFSSRHAAKVAVAAELAATGRSMKNGKGARSRQIHLVCKTCTSWVVRGCQQKGDDFKITKQGRGLARRLCWGRADELRSSTKPLVDQLVRANPKIVGPAIKRTLKTVGFTVSDRQSQRAKKRIATASKEDEAAAISRLPSLFEGTERDCPGSVATVEVSPDNRFVRSFLMFRRGGN